MRADRANRYHIEKSDFCASAAAADRTIFSITVDGALMGRRAWPPSRVNTPPRAVPGQGPLIKRPNAVKAGKSARPAGRKICFQWPEEQQNLSRNKISHYNIQFDIDFSNFLSAFPEICPPSGSSRMTTAIPGSFHAETEFPYPRAVACRIRGRVRHSGRGGRVHALRSARNRRHHQARRQPARTGCAQLDRT